VRIIGGLHRGKTIHVTKGLDVRPTTDFAKEGLFNILNNKIDFEGMQVLDLFAGTGNIAFEFASRGSYVTSVDKNFDCVKFVSKTARELNLNISTLKSDVFKFLKTHTNPYDLIFVDPPYALENIPEIHQIIFENNLLKENSWLIIEHGPTTKLDSLPHFIEQRKYGNVNFSFFQKVPGS
jgi:16S rRNA (guanine(966)-N(2))-methyltransferase RsmD